MTSQQFEDLAIRSLDTTLTNDEQQQLQNELSANPVLKGKFYAHQRIRMALLRKEPASFGTTFATKLVARIENSGIMIERQIFSFFKKYQLLAAGVIVGLLLLNALLSETITVNEVLGLESTNSTTEEIVSFDFNQLLNTNL